MADTRLKRDELYEEAAASCGTALDRLARAYEPDPDKRRDLLQEIHVALWRSFENFEGRCSLTTWSWYILPMLPGTAMLLIAMSRMPGFGTRVGLIYGVLFAIAFVVVGKLSKRKAHQLQQKIDELRE